MAAYVIVDVAIHDPVTYAEYRSLTPAAITASSVSWMLLVSSHSVG